MRSSKLNHEIHEHAKMTAPEECCGVIINADTFPVYVKLKNVSETPQIAFLIDPDEIAKYDNISYIVHSHIGDNPELSDEDKVSCHRCNIPFMVVAEKTGEIVVYNPSEGNALPLVGRPFLHSVNDCFGLVKDYFWQTHSIKMADYRRKKYGWCADPKNDHEFEQGLINEGAYEVNPANGLKVGDIIVMNVRGAVPNHLAVYVGDNCILHHLTDKKSQIEMYGFYWQKATKKVMRLKRMDAKCS